MKKLLLETSFSKIYMIVMIIITLLILGGYFSYAMFTVTKEKSNVISIVTGNLTYKLEVDGEESNTLTVEANSSKEFVVTLSNPNNRIARFNFYYIGDLIEGTDTGYIETDGYNVVPSSTGVNLEKSGSSGSSNIYLIRVNNITDDEIAITLGVSVGLDYNDLELPSEGHIFRKLITTGKVKDVLEDDIMNRLNYEDSEQTFITGEEPYNYIWYSGKLWRAVATNPSDNSVKLVTEWNISSISYSNGSSSFEGSYMKDWLNDETVDGFLGNLREPEKFIRMDSVWNATMTSSTDKPSKTTMVTAPVGLLNIYEFITSYSGTTAIKGYLNNGLWWYTITPNNSTNIYSVTYYGNLASETSITPAGIRPSINLKSEVKIIDGRGTSDDPYRLEGDNDINLNGTLLNTRYSGEYISFGDVENNLYRIVSHETSGLTKITSAEPLKYEGEFIVSTFGSSSSYLNPNQIVVFLNGYYLTGYMSEEYNNMIEPSTTWYMGLIDNGYDYRLAKYTDVSMTSTTTSAFAKVGLLRYGELMASQFEKFGGKESETYTNKTIRYWLINTFVDRKDPMVAVIHQNGIVSNSFSTTNYGVKPAMNLKANVIITSGDGTKNNPFELSVQ